jgi:hypothetical protein
LLGISTLFTRLQIGNLQNQKFVETSYKINVKVNRMDNQEWTIRRHGRH